MPELTEWHKAFAIFMELYVEPLFIIPIAVYFIIAGIAEWIIALIPAIQSLLAAWGG